jgi:Arc/MetJ-type ribon-helix-helix transcriptional regulator
MTKVLREAIAKVEALPEIAQDQIARELIDYVDKLNALRADLEVGIRQLDAGEGKELDIEDLLRRARAQHVKK